MEGEELEMTRQGFLVIGAEFMSRFTSVSEFDNELRRDREKRLNMVRLDAWICCDVE